jgi:hypothetical protein
MVITERCPHGRPSPSRCTFCYEAAWEERRAAESGERQVAIAAASPAKSWATSAKVWVAALALAVVSLTGALVTVSLQLREASKLDQPRKTSFELEKACIESGGNWIMGYCHR